MSQIPKRNTVQIRNLLELKLAIAVQQQRGESWPEVLVLERLCLIRQVSHTGM